MSKRQWRLATWVAIVATMLGGVLTIRDRAWEWFVYFVAMFFITLWCITQGSDNP